MPGKIPINQIAHELTKAEEALHSYCVTLTDAQFFHQPGEKWSVAQQVRHLTTATRTATLAFTIPKFIVRWIGGRPNRPSRTYDALVERYKLKLEQGGRASRWFSPKPVADTNNKERILKKYSKAVKKMSRVVKKKWNENQTDFYIAPHPLLGKITLRELCYFTIYHSWHHLESIRKLTSD